MAKTIAQAAEDNDRRAMLVALRTRIAETLGDPDTHPRELASLSKRLMEIADEIETIDAQRGQVSGESERAAPADESFDGSDV